MKDVSAHLIDFMNEQVEYTGRFFLDAIRPIYGTTSRQEPDHIGSCILLNVEGGKILLTAAHVIDENKYSSLYVGGSGAKSSDDGELVLIEGDFYATNKIEESRDKDHYDFAFWQLDQRTIDKLGAVKFIDENHMMIESSIGVNDFFLALGYPNTKNKKVNNYTCHVSSLLWHYWGQVKTSEALSKKLSITGENHLYLHYDFKKSATSDGKIITATKPTGVSGGVIINIEFPTLDKLQNNRYVKGVVAGLIIEGHKDHKAMVCTKMSIILKAVYSNIQNPSK